MADDVEREVAERVEQAQAIAGAGRRVGLALEAQRGALHVAALERELAERVPRGGALGSRRTAAS